MLKILKFDIYRDGGTISLTCNIGGPKWSKYINDHHLSEDRYEICIDRRVAKSPQIWLGYPEAEGSSKIEDDSLVDYIIEKVKSYKQVQNTRMDFFLNYKQNITDWKIKNIIS